MLSTLGLLHPPTHTATKEDVLDTIRQLSVLQIDTIHIINRSPYIVLWSRLGKFDIAWLDELLAERQLFEYWSHEACFLPLEDFPYYRAIIQSKANRHITWATAWLREHRAEAAHVLNHITHHGYAMSSTFNASQKPSGGWWNWKVEKLVLEALFAQGTLTVSERKKFQRVYVSVDEVIPEQYRIDTKRLSETYETFVDRTVRILGIAAPHWVHDYFRLPRKETERILKKHLRKGSILPVSVEGFDEQLYIHTKNRQLVETAVSGKLAPSHTTFLSPFDPLMWDRNRVHELFNFHYRIESYTPHSKRIFGYFTLPILHNGTLIGRMDAKAHRAEERFEVKSIHFEPHVAPDGDMIHRVAMSLNDFARWHGATSITLPEAVRREFEAHLPDF